MPEDSGIFTYPEGWQEVVEALDFLPEEQRAFMLQALVMLSTAMI
ncbi:MAG: hypothetical protein ACOC6F_02855 [bacterium]